MDFVDFAKAHGIVIDSYPPLGRWKRYPTVDHPRKRNGAVKWLGDHGFVQNWAVDQDVAVWKGEASVDVDRIKRQVDRAEAKRRFQQSQAARKAREIIRDSVLAKHAYLEAKGFPDAEGLVWSEQTVKRLVIPMRVDGQIVGCQLIDEDGTKKFLFGQQSGGAEYIIDNKGAHVLVEGYATALSVQAALKSMKRAYTLHVCFSAGNLVKVAKHLPRGFVVADNDASFAGEKAAKETGWPYWMPPTVGQDFNDFYREVGLFKCSMSLHKAMISAGIPSR